MAIIVSTETYDRFIVDPEDIEAYFTFEGEEVSTDRAAELAVEITERIKKGDVDTEKLETHQRIKEGAKRIIVTFRPLRAVDRTIIENTAQMAYGDASGQALPGTMRRLAVKRGVVKWDFKPAFSEAVLDNLNSGVFEQLYAWLSWDSEPLEQDPESGLPLAVTPGSTEPSTTSSEAKNADEPTPIRGRQGRVSRAGTGTENES